ncbi:MAG: DUF2283 domain-containing protein [Candidatus Aenigmatarchaeota archaeon]
MKITYSETDDAAYIYLVEAKPGVAARTEPCEIAGLRGEINLDFDKNGRLVGIEVLGASKVLPKEILDRAERLS